jgi:hypothetical protein
MITKLQLNELISITMENMPLPPIEDMLSIPCDNDFDVNCVAEFIHKHYSAEDVLRGLNAHLEHCKFVVKLFGNKE